MQDLTTKDPTVDKVIRQLTERSRVGMDTYKISMHDNPLNLDQWLDHAIEEALDLACYLTRIKEEWGKVK